MKIENVVVTKSMGRYIIDCVADGLQARLTAEQKPVFTNQGFVMCSACEYADKSKPRTINLEASGLTGYEGTLTERGLIPSQELVDLVDACAAGVIQEGPFDLQLLYPHPQEIYDEPPE